jgi:hypothetical protein
MADEQPARFRVNGKDYEIPSTFTIGEMCDAERYFGVEFGNEAGSSIRTAAALLWIAVHREDPGVTVEQIRQLPPDVFTAFDREDARPPASDDENKSKNGGSGTSTGGGSDGQAALQQISGGQTSATGATSDPATFAS